MIIFGTRGVTISKESGTFYCPECTTRQPYKLKKARRFFTLYFIPVIPLDALGEFVECQVCKGTYRTNVLQYDPDRQAERIEAEFRRALRHVMLQMMLADGRIDEKEVEAVSAVYESLTGDVLTADEVRREAMAQTGTTVDIRDYLVGLAGLLNDEGKEMVVKAVFLTAMSDGDLAEQEMAFLLLVGRALQMSKHHVRSVVQEMMESAA
ncbi:MAG: TerB family tellurite resistance protein [Hyphomicrobiales bacterium]|nr:TerB family tellurite resistance protein [Hyphomicrobiales bacterium]